MSPPRSRPRWARLGRLTRGFTLSAAASLCGCYSYASASPGAVPTNARVRVTLSQAGVDALAPAVGAAVAALEGQLVRRSGDTLVVRADKLLTTADVDVAWTGRDLTLPPAWQRDVDRRRLAVGRTSLLVGGSVALAAGVVALVRQLGDSQGDQGPGGGPVVFFVGRP